VSGVKIQIASELKVNVEFSNFGMTLYLHHIITVNIECQLSLKRCKLNNGKILGMQPDGCKKSTIVKTNGNQ